MVVTDSIVRPNFLLKSTLRKVQKGEDIYKVKREAKKSSLDTVSLKRPKPFKLSDVNVLEQGYFKGNKYFKLGKGTPWQGGVLGDPVPYTFSGDNILAGALLLCFIITMGGFSISRDFITAQLQTFFGAPRSLRYQAENIKEGKAIPFLLLQTSLLLSVIFFILTNKYYGHSYEEGMQLTHMGIYFGEFIAYFVIKRLFYGIVNWTFFERDCNKRWMKAWTFLSAMEGALLFPLVLLLVYFDLNFKDALIYGGIVIVLVKLLQLYKEYTIFFSRKTGRLQIFLYFCTLEIMPLIVLGGVLDITSNYLKINF